MSANTHKYSISLMCRLLEISRQTYYNHINKDDRKKAKKIQEVDENVKRTFDNSRGSFKTRMIRTTLLREGIEYSRPLIATSMKRQNLKSSYNIKRKFNKPTSYNQAKIDNVVSREFTQPLNHILTSGLTYFKVNSITCFVIDLYNSEIVGHSVSKRKNPDEVLQAFNTIKFPLENVKVFHTDRGTEFKNKQIDKLLECYNIQRSLSKPGCPYDNVVSESAFKSLKHAWLKSSNYNTEAELIEDVGTINHIDLSQTVQINLTSNYTKQRKGYLTNKTLNLIY